MSRTTAGPRPCKGGCGAVIEPRPPGRQGRQREFCDACYLAKWRPYYTAKQRERRARLKAEAASRRNDLIRSATAVESPAQS